MPTHVNTAVAETAFEQMSLFMQESLAAPAAPDPTVAPAPLVSEDIVAAVDADLSEGNPPPPLPQLPVARIPVDGDLLDKIQALPGMKATSVWHQVREVFRLMEIAESEIERGRRLYPEYAQAIWSSFLLYQEFGYPFTQRHEQVYRHHCRELIERIAAEGPMGPPTKAEMLIGIMDFFTNVAPSNVAVGLAMRLWNEIFAGHRTHQFSVMFPDRDSWAREEWVGQFDDILAEIRRSSRTFNSARVAMWKEIQERES